MINNRYKRMGKSISILLCALLAASISTACNTKIIINQETQQLGKDSSQEDTKPTQSGSKSSGNHVSNGNSEADSANATSKGSGLENSEESEGSGNSGSSGGSGSSENSEHSGADGSQKGTDTEQPDSQVAGETGIEAFLTLKKTQTKLGSIEIPLFKEKKLSGNDISMANGMFLSIEKKILEYVKVCEEMVKKNNITLEESQRNGILCETKVSLNQNILSVLVHYNDNEDYDAPSFYVYEAVNIDTNTGKALPSAQLIQDAGYSQEQVESSLFWYGDRFLYKTWESMTYYQFANDRILPGELGHPNPQWALELEEIINAYRTAPEPQGTEWDKLDRYPTVFYEGSGELSVCGEIPTPAGAGFTWTMVHIGKNQPERVHKNPTTPFGVPFGNYAMTTESAVLALSRKLELDGEGKTADGTKLNIEPLSMDYLEDMGENVEPVYLLKVDGAGESGAKVNGQWAVGAFSGSILKQDATSGQWKEFPGGPKPLLEEMMDSGRSDKAAAVLCLDPNEYEIWESQYCDLVDLSLLAEEPYDSYAAEIEELLLFAMEDDTAVSFVSGKKTGDSFETQKVVSETVLQKGQCLYVPFNRPKNQPNQAIIVQNKVGKVTYVIENTPTQ